MKGSVCLTGAAHIILAMHRGGIPVMMCCYSLTHRLLASTQTQSKEHLLLCFSTHDE